MNVPVSAASRRVAIVLMAGVGLLVALAVGLVVARNHQGQAVSSDAAARVASVQTGCQDWAGTSPSAVSPQWCSEMAGWMSRELTQDGASATGMWGDPSRLLATCKQWMTAGPPELPAPPAWCSDMVDWMGAHMQTWSGRTGWSDWMMHGGSMMDR